MTTTIRDIKQNTDILSIVFDFAGNWNNRLPFVSKAWKLSFEKHLFTQWKALEKCAGPDLLCKIKIVDECNSGRVVRKKFIDLRSLLKERLFPSPKPAFSLIDRVQRFFITKEIPEKGIVHEILQLQKKIERENGKKSLLDNISQLTGSRMTGSQIKAFGSATTLHEVARIYSEYALANINAIINRWQTDHALFIFEPDDLTELPVALIKAPLKALWITDNSLIPSIPEQISENLFLQRLCLDVHLYETLPVTIREYLEKQVRLGRCEFESSRLASRSWAKYSVAFGSGSFLYDRSFGSPFQEYARKSISITVKEDFGPTLFYNELCYRAESPLGRLYQAAYREEPLEELRRTFDILTASDQLKLYSIMNGLAEALLSSLDDPHGYSLESYLREPGSVCKAVNRMLHLMLPGPGPSKLCEIISQLGKSHNDPFWTEDDPKWGDTHCNVNKGRLADALMYLEKESSKD